MQRQEFTEKMATFLQSQNPDSKLSLDGDSDIVRLGLIDSLRVTDLIIAAEELTDKKIPLEHFDVMNFRSLHKLYDSYFAE